MTPHAAFIRLPWQSNYRCTTCLEQVAPSQRVPHLNRATTRAGLDGNRPTTDLGDDE